MSSGVHYFLENANFKTINSSKKSIPCAKTRVHLGKNAQQISTLGRRGCKGARLKYVFGVVQGVYSLRKRRVAVLRDKIWSILTYNVTEKPRMLILSRGTLPCQRTSFSRTVNGGRRSDAHSETPQNLQSYGLLAENVHYTLFSTVPL